MQATRPAAQPVRAGLPAPSGGGNHLHVMIVPAGAGPVVVAVADHGAQPEGAHGAWVVLQPGAF